MWRVFLSVAVLALVALPSILICLSPSRPAGLRLVLAVMAFMAPLVLIWAIHLVPALAGNSPHHSPLWRGLGVVLSVGSLIIPWLIYSALRERTGQGGGRNDGHIGGN